MHDGRGGGRKLECITIATRDEHRAKSAFLVCHGGGEKVVGLVAWRLGIRKPDSGDQVGQDLQLIDELVIKMTPALVGRKKSLPECRRTERVPADQYRAWLFTVIEAQQEIGKARDRATAAVAGPPYRFRQIVVGAVPEGVTVNDKER